MANVRKQTARREFNFIAPTKGDLEKTTTTKVYDRPLKATTDFFVPKEGTNIIRILPIMDSPEFAVPVKIHYNIGENGEQYLCPRMFGKDCPICDESFRLNKEGLEKESKELKASSRYLAYVIDRDGDASKVLMYLMPWGVFSELSTACIDERSGKVFHMVHPDNGFDACFRKTGKGMMTKYSGVKVYTGEPCSISDDDTIYNDMLDFIEENPLNECFDLKDYDYIKAKFTGKMVATVEDDTVSTTRTRRPVAKEEPEEVCEDEEVYEEDDVFVEEEPVQQRRRSR